MPIQINTLEVENLKRIKAVKIDCTGRALTIVGGRNGQGKTSVLDAIAYALGGAAYRPTEATREGSMVPPEIKVTLNNGLIVERRGKNSDLKVTDPAKGRAGQQLLNDFIHQFALDLPKFMNAHSSEKAETLLKIIGVGDQLKVLEQAEKKAYDDRRAIGQIADQKKKYADEMPSYPNAPDAPISASELIQSQQAILLKNEENKRKRENVVRIKNDIHFKAQGIIAKREEIERLKTQLKALESAHDELVKDLIVADKTAQVLQDESTAEIEQKLHDIDSINIKVRANLDKQKALDDASEYQSKYDALTFKIEAIREQKSKLLDGADLPLEGLSVQDGELTYNGQKWDCMSGSEQMRVATAIVRKLNPECGFVLLDKLEQMDLDTLREFGQWLESEGLQAIATRVSTGNECSIIIEDGSGTLEAAPRPVEATPKFKAGSF